MVFSSLAFLFFFLPASLLLYFASPARWRNATLAVLSLVFYAWGAGPLVFVLIASAAVNFGLGIAAASERRWRSLPVARLAVIASVAANLALLGYFKYANFFVDQLTSTQAWLGLEPIAWSRVVLPIGISFFTFQAMSYVIDVARRAHPPERRPVDFLLFKSCFPQLIAGPIVRYQEIAADLRERRTRVEDFAAGALRFAHGLAKKVLVADPLGSIAAAAFGLPAAELDAASAWIGVVAYTFQIYFDFSGYSDMAIGMGHLFGFHYPENFDRPYSAVSITDFWRRWHMTLSRWFRDYLYVPLGGSRVAPARLYSNLGVVFLCTGLWHGANWTFVLWGAYHGSLLILERLTGVRDLGDDRARVARRALTLFLVALGWVLFRAHSPAHAIAYYGAMVDVGAGPLSPAVAATLTNQALATLLLAPFVALLPRDFVAGRYLARGDGWLCAGARLGVVAVLLPWSVLQVARGSFSPFLYFQF
jgi:alginate O-acetyltransferase complex protein AlgI